MPIRSSSMGGTPFGNTANRPSNPQVGQTYYNGELGYLEIYTSAGWIPASGGNDFNLNLTGPYTTVTFVQSYASGSYSITSGSNDTTLDIYAFASDGSSAGYTSTKSFTATQRFNKMVIVGGTNGDVLGFSYKTTYATSNTTSEVNAGPFITNISPSFMANIDDTITITGGNFATDITAVFSGTGYSLTGAKSIVRSSSSSLIITRPDNFPVSASPYTLTLTNPSVANQPVGSNSHIASNAITAGNAPVWVTSNTLSFFTKNVSYSQVIQATDSDGGSNITYSVVSNSLPTGLSFNTSTATISGTPSDSINGTITIRATDSGGNYVDRQFTIPNIALVWATSATLPAFSKNSAYSQSISATDDGTVTYAITSGSLPTGLSLNSSTGLISGTASTSLTTTFTVRATDDAGNFTDRTFTLPNAVPVWITTSLPSARNSGDAYSYTLNVTDDGTFSVVLYSGTLPSGFSYNSSTRVISGSSVTASSTSLTFRATDDNGGISDQTMTFAVAAATTTTITSSQSWTAPAGVTSVDLFMVGGGGSSGVTAANGYSGGGTGGGGGGGTVYQTSVSVSPGTSYNIVVGAGGSKGISNNPNDGPSETNDGSNSTAFGYTAIGGNGVVGAGWGGGNSTGTGGPGGGGSSYDNSMTTSGNGNGNRSQGGSGGSSGSGTGGGGGGASGNGASGDANGAGGAGVTQFGVTLGGGGGGGSSTISGGTGGSGGGANGTNGFYGNAGTAGLGGGGGGIRGGNGSNDPYNESGAGGSGRVMIRYYS